MACHQETGGMLQVIQRDNMRMAQYSLRPLPSLSPKSYRKDLEWCPGVKGYCQLNTYMVWFHTSISHPKFIAEIWEQNNISKKWVQQGEEHDHRLLTNLQVSQIGLEEEGTQKLVPKLLLINIHLNSQTYFLLWINCWHNLSDSSCVGLL